MYTLIFIGFIYLSPFSVVIDDIPDYRRCMNIGKEIHSTSKRVNNRTVEASWTCIKKEK